MRAVWAGHFPYEIQKLHARYGDIVRTAPNELSSRTQLLGMISILTVMEPTLKRFERVNSGMVTLRVEQRLSSLRLI